jgi:hypothetical protein
VGANWPRPSFSAVCSLPTTDPSDPSARVGGSGPSPPSLAQVTGPAMPSPVILLWRLEFLDSGLGHHQAEDAVDLVSHRGPVDQQVLRPADHGPVAPSEMVRGVVMACSNRRMSAALA